MNVIHGKQHNAYTFNLKGKHIMLMPKREWVVVESKGKNILFLS